MRETESVRRQKKMHVEVRIRQRDKGRKRDKERDTDNRRKRDKERDEGRMKADMETCRDPQPNSETE